MNAAMFIKKRPQIEDATANPKVQMALEKALLDNTFEAVEICMDKCAVKYDAAKVAD